MIIDPCFSYQGLEGFEDAPDAIGINVCIMFAWR